MRKIERAIVVAAILGLSAAAAMASETITYTYDARGRLVKVVHSGSVNNNLIANYTLDNADNRTNQKITGSANAPP